jgi:VRR-NUC domain.
VKRKIQNSLDKRDKNTGLQEKQVEQTLVRAARQRGGIALKFVSPAYDGMPDRLVLMFGGRCAFVEVKAPGKRPRPLQWSRHRFLQRLGFRVYVLDDPAKVAGILDEIGGDAQ